MTEPHMDQNDLARFLDGGMPEEERSRAVAHLSESDPDAELLADAAFMLRDLEGQEAVVVGDITRADHPHHDEADTGDDSRVVPLRPPSTARTWRRGPVRWLALAAVLAGVVLVPLALSRSGGRDSGDFAALLAHRDTGLPAGWTERRAWSVSRGGGVPQIEDTRAVQLGALHTDLEIAVAARQADQTADLAGQIVARLRDVTAGGTVAPAYEAIGARAGDSPQALAEPLKTARENLAGLAGDDYFALGAWTEAAMLAAERRDAAFFQARASRTMLDRAASLTSDDPEARAALDAIRAAAGADPPDWAALQTQTRALMRRIGG